MDVNVALLPDAQLSEALAGLSRDLARFGNTLILDAGRGPFPHLTLYLTGFEEDSVPAIAPLIANNVAHLEAPALHVTGGAVSDQGTVLLSVEKTPPLDHLHRWMIHKLNPFRMRARPQIWEERRGRFGPAELDRLDRLGFPQALDAWSPHFTIGKVARDQGKAVREALKAVRLAGAAPRIGVGTVGPHGSFPSVLGTAELKRP